MAPSSVPTDEARGRQRVVSLWDDLHLERNRESIDDVTMEQNRLEMDADYFVAGTSVLLSSGGDARTRNSAIDISDPVG